MSALERVRVVPDPGVRARISPELVALGLVGILTIAVLLPPVMPRLSFGAAVEATPSPPPALASDHPEPRFDTASIKLLLEINRIIGQSQAPLRAEIAQNVLDGAAVRSELSRIVLNVRVGLDATARLQSRSDTRAVGKRVAAYYQDLREIADRSFAAALANVPVHRRAAQDMVAALARRAALDEELTKLLARSDEPSAEPRPSPQPTPSPEPSAPPTTTPSIEPSVPATAAPTPPPGSASAVPGDVIVNGGFETGASPWEVLLRDTAALATANVDKTQRRFGTASLRVEVTTSSESRTGIAVVQSALRIHSGRYVVRLYARADVARQVRVAVGNSAGWTYAERLFDIGTAWTVLQFEFSAITGDESATLEVDLGRSNAAVWLDAITVAPAG
jgi:hypothetical protein